LRVIRFIVAAFSLGLLSQSAIASLLDDQNDCNKHIDPAACTRILNLPRLDKKNRVVFLDNRGTALYNKGQMDLALADYSEAIRLQPNYAFAYNNRGRILEERGEYDRALSDYNTAIRLVTNQPVMFNGRGNVWFDKSEFNRALADYDEAIRLDPNYADAFNGQGNTLKGLGDFDRAIDSFSTAIRLNPGNSYFYTGRAATWQEKGEFERAIADYTMAIRFNPHPGLPYNNRGLLWRDKGDYDRAIADFDEAIRLDPKSRTAYANRGEIWRLKGDLDRALSDQGQQIRVRPDYSLGYLLRGDTHRYRGDYESALADYDKALALEKLDTIPPYVGRGLTYEKMGNLARARIEFEKATNSASQNRSDNSRSSLQTALARLAALNSGEAQPTISAAPAKVTNATSVPTPVIASPGSLPAKISGGGQGRRVALVIGNSAYKSVPALTNPQNDASAVAQSLRSVGFDSVTLVGDATREKLIDNLRAFANEADGADWAMVYYAGHGIEVGGINYLIPVDAKLRVDRDIEYEAVPLFQILNATNAARKIKLVVLDACRDNPFAPRKTSTPEAIIAPASNTGRSVSTRSTNGRGLAEVKVQGATLVVFAAKEGQAALDGDGQNSPFAVAVVQRISTPGVEINKLFRLIRDDVMEATAGRQEPYTYGSLPGNEDFFFVAKF
jgi:tetratricopeptide (TPR) repeat protein